ncbi:MAG TPA: glycine--tRNA ligase [Chthoniobacterales bacterium]|nr:glycine--tRNA ligase [Chthoniobacterales bacterium]
MSATDSQRMEKIVSLCKRRGFIFQSSEIYGGLNGLWDYGPLGVELKRNLKNYWWRVMVHERDDVVGMDGSILMNRAVWKASGHEDTFSDPMVDCLLTQRRFRADQIEPQSGTVLHFAGAVDEKLLRETFDYTFGDIDELKRRELEEHYRQCKSLDDLTKHPNADVREFAKTRLGQIARPIRLDEPFSVLLPKGKPPESARKIAIQYYQQRGLANPTVSGERTEKVENTTRYNPENGSLLTEPRSFNLMFKTYVGATEDESSVTYLRPETAQAIFVQFKNVLDVSRKKLPFGIAQIGKAFRNEINPRNFTFRSREFEQMELEYFCRPEEGMKLLEYWKEERLRFYENIGIPTNHLHVLTVPDEERAFYSKGTYDIEYDFPFGRQELEGVAYRTDYDLSQHQKASGKSLEYFDEETKQKFIPHVIEPSAGVDRTVLALICEAYSEDEAPDEKGKMETRTVLRFHPRVAPVKCAVFPLLKNKEPLVAKAKEIVRLLRPHMFVFYDESGAIGRRYRRQDEVGTPFGVTVDFETLGEKDVALKDTVTLRERDSMKQERVAIKDLAAILVSRIS